MPLGLVVFCRRLGFERLGCGTRLGRDDDLGRTQQMIARSVAGANQFGHATGLDPLARLGRDRFVYLRIEQLADRADALDSEPVDRALELERDQHHTPGPGMLLEVRRQVRQRPVEIVQERQKLLDGGGPPRLLVGGSLDRDAPLEVGEVGLGTLRQLEVAVAALARGG